MQIMFETTSVTESKRAKRTLGGGIALCAALALSGCAVKEAQTRQTSTGIEQSAQSKDGLKSYDITISRSGIGDVRVHNQRVSVPFGDLLGLGEDGPSYDLKVENLRCVGLTAMADVEVSSVDGLISDSNSRVTAGVLHRLNPENALCKDETLGPDDMDVLAQQVRSLLAPED